MTDALVIGAGPAGLMAAEQLVQAGVRVLVVEAKPSVGRKLLMAGKSGLNLTKDEAFETFLDAYGCDALAPMLRAFGPGDVQAWARDLGQELFTGTSGRVFPEAMKASPLLRNWLARLSGQGVEFRTRWHWTGWDGAALAFDTDAGRQHLCPRVTVLACGGASWARLGADGTWAGYMGADQVAGFAPSNAAVAVDWSAHMQPHFGAAVKAVRWSAVDLVSRGEAVISARGLEGGGLYALTPALRSGAELSVDLVPDLNADQVAAKLSSKPGKQRLSHWLRNGLRLPAVKIALFHEFARGRAATPSDWVRLIKALPVDYAGLRPMDEAISTAGGLRFAAVDDRLMLRARPGVFVAGEMLDWEAPTGGYLLSACLATGRWAGCAAAEYVPQG